jgi:hypothetical protein
VVLLSRRSDNGRAVLRFDLARVAKLQGKAAPDSTLDLICPEDWMCFFEHANYGGRRLRFRDCCYFQYFSNYGMQNRVSSWRNRLDVNDVRVWDTGPSPDVGRVGDGGVARPRAE